jgi:protein-tyrosine phosphatase
MEHEPSILNFRDLGGIPCEDGSIVRPHKLYRSAALERASAVDCGNLIGYCDVGTVIDLRTRLERGGHPDPALPGVKRVEIPLMPAQTLLITLQDDNWQELVQGSWNPDTYDACAAYRMIAGPSVEDGWRAIFKALLDSGGHAVLWHCTNGKDRTGVVAATILRALGVPPEIVMEDYLRSNDELREQRKRILQVAKLRKDKPGLQHKIGPLLQARPEYLNAFFDAADENYGSFDGFLEDACQLSIAEDDQLRELFLQ